MVTSMLVNFLLMCLSVLFFPTVNPSLFARIQVFKSRALQIFIGTVGVIFLSTFLIIHSWKDLQADLSAWYFHSTWIWLLVMGVASVFFLIRWKKILQTQPDARSKFSQLPPES